MPDSKQQFLCCTRKQIAILRCPQCKQLLGYCRACSTLFHKLQDLSSSLVVNPERAIECASCQFVFPKAGAFEKYLAVRRDLAQAGLAALVTEELQLSTVAREDDPLDNYRQNLSKIGWGGASSGTDFSAAGTEMMDKMAKRRLVVLLLLMILVGTGVGVYYWVFKTPPPPPKPVKPAIKKK